MATKTEAQFTLRIIVDEDANRVMFARCRKDFAEVLLSFLTLPLGTIARPVAKESNIKKVSVGSLSSWYESVVNMEAKHFWTETCKEMLLQPRNSMEAYCQNLKLNIDDTETMKYRPRPPLQYALPVLALAVVSLFSFQHFPSPCVCLVENEVLEQLHRANNGSND
ncbi:hypothetical protein RIF29_40053 [Crotalaria pallida]|uniref:Uncharacterized protein n=1 Tax=Crotalaria pallida TaxID=3830 RepID=A0AAN9E2F2_CROPI